MKDRRILVAGFGNPLIPGDDCGLRVVEELRRLGVDARWLGRGVQALIHILPGYDEAVLVDASRRAPAGEVRVARLECSGARPASLHEAGLLEAACMALEAAEAVTGRRPVVYLVECGVGAGEPPIREAVEAVLGLLYGEQGPRRRGAGEEAGGAGEDSA